MLLKVPSSVEELQESLKRYHIALMASSPPGQLIQKYFFYAQQVNRIYNHDMVILFISKRGIQVLQAMREDSASLEKGQGLITL